MQFFLEVTDRADSSGPPIVSLPGGSHLLQELSSDKAVAESDLARKLGTLRYLTGLKTQRARAVRSSPPGAKAPPPFLTGKGEHLWVNKTIFILFLNSAI